MDFRVLGPLTVRDSDRALKLGGHRQQLVLAVLLLHPERELSAEWLVDAVWGDEPPQSARKTLQAYVSRLRRILGDDVIVATDHGYAVHVTPTQLDSLRFEELSTRGSQLLASNAAGAADLLGRALELWSAMPFGDLGYEQAIQPEAQRLLELRLTTLENRIAADLDLGLAASLVGELAQLVEEHPLRERLHGQLMLALYRSERQAASLPVDRPSVRSEFADRGSHGRRISSPLPVRPDAAVRRADGINSHSFGLSPDRWPARRSRAPC